MATYTANYAMIKPSYADVADVAAINQNTDTIDEIMHGSQTSIADAYDPAETYAAGDLAMHDFQLYKCNTDDTTGTWDPTKWERTTAAAAGGGGGGSAVSITPTLQSGTKIADFEIDGVSGALYAPSGGGGGSSEIYDDTEQVVGTYFGDTLYRKTFKGTTPSTQMFLGLTIKEFVKAMGYIKKDNYKFVFPYRDTGDYINMAVTPTNDIRVTYTSYFNNGEYNFTIEYTKPTT